MRRESLIAAIIVLLAILVTIPLGAQTRAVTPVATVKQIQEAMVSPSSDVIFNVGRVQRGSRNTAA